MISAGNPNLGIMDDARLTNGDRARIARGWRASGLTQPAYAALHAVTDRTLRAWIARWALPCQNAPEATRKMLSDLVERAQTMLAQLTEPEAVQEKAPDPDTMREVSTEGSVPVEPPTVPWKKGFDFCSPD
jgi:DNA-binding transcriptional regulator YiaG